MTPVVGAAAGPSRASDRPVPTKLPSIRNRLVLSLGAIALGIFLGASLLLDWSLGAELRKQELAEANAQMAMVRHFIESNPARLGERRRELDDMLASHPDWRVWILAPDGTPLYGGVPPGAGGERNGLLALRVPDGIYRGLRAELNDPGPLTGTTVLVGLNTAERERLMVGHRTTLLLVSILATLLIALSTAWAASRGLAPVAALSRHATRIQPDAPGMRLPARGTVRELHELAQSFNAVLDRLEEAYRHLEAFNADVAHELRTPLATMINGTQVTLSSPRSADELRETLLSNLEELEGMKRLVNDMLFLARADRGERIGEASVVSLAAEAAVVGDYYEAALQEAGVSFEVTGDASVEGNGVLIRRAIANLVSNALRYTAKEGTITVVIHGEAGKARLKVRNPGPAIQAIDLGRIFERFYRVTSPNGPSHEGSGLGLAIVRAIARMHGGETFAHSAGGVTEIGFALPSTHARKPNRGRAS